MEKKKISIAPCSGLSPYGLVTRVASSDAVAESENAVSICITATSADRSGFRDIIKKYPIIAVNGCENACVNYILKSKGVNVAETINVTELLREEDLKPYDAVRLDENGEKCVNAVRNKIKRTIDKMNG